MFCYDNDDDGIHGFSSFISNLSPDTNNICSYYSPIEFHKENQNEIINYHHEDEDLVEKINEGNQNNEINTIKENKEIRDNEITGFTSNKNNDIKIILNQECQNIIMDQNEQINKDNTKLKKYKLLGRKKKYSNESGQHDKFSDDNLSRKCKSIILKHLRYFINHKIIYYNNNTDGIKKNLLLKINHNQIKSSKVDYNRDFLNKQLKDIFSDNISSKYSKYPRDHNKNLIQNLLNEKDVEKRKIFEKIFGLTFLECLKHFRGSIYIEELEGMATLNEVCNGFPYQKDLDLYIMQFKYFITNFEKIIMEKNIRNRKKRKE